MWESPLDGLEVWEDAPSGCELFDEVLYVAALWEVVDVWEPPPPPAPPAPPAGGGAAGIIVSRSSLSGLRCGEAGALIRNSPPLGPYSRNMSRALWWS